MALVPGLLVCRGCEAHISVLAGTIFHRTRTSLRTWFLAAWEITSQKYGANALGLQRVLGLSSYKTAWAWLHKFRRAMVRPGRDRLDGIVEIDETSVGGLEEGARGYTETKAIVVIAVQIEDEKPLGRVRMRPVSDVSAASLRPFISDVVEPGATIITSPMGGAGIPDLPLSDTITLSSANRLRPIRPTYSCRDHTAWRR